MSRRSRSLRLPALAATALLAAACTTPAPGAPPGGGGVTFTTPPATTGSPGAASPGGGAASCQGAQPGQFFNQQECERQLRLRTVTAQGPADQPWIQALEPQMVDTTQFRKEGPQKVCFSNAGVNNPWRVVGFNTMEHEVQIQRDAGKISDFVHVDAGGNDAKQITDIAGLVATGGCGALIVSPNTTAALTPAVEAACRSNIPIIVFDRGVNTQCPVTFIHPIGGYAFGADAAEFIVRTIPPGGSVLALRILPGVDVLETRFSAAKAIFQQNGINLLAPNGEFTGGEPAKTKQIVTQYLQRGRIDAVWMDAGATSVAATEAFEDAGVEIPPITGEDQNDFLMKWQQEGLQAVAPTYPTYQWRTAIIAAVQVLGGQQVPKEWILPQPLITSENLNQYVTPNMPPLFYALCGCQNMPGFPQDWQR